MSILIRKINKAKWLKTEISEGAPVCADAITNCLKTTENTLSVWEVPDENSLNSAIFAIVGTHEHLDTIDLVILQKELAVQNNISIQETIGNTRISALKDTHRDFANLSYAHLGVISQWIAKEIVDKRSKRYTRAELRKILKSAVTEGKLDINELHESIRVELSK